MLLELILYRQRPRTRLYQYLRFRQPRTLLRKVRFSHKENHHDFLSFKKHGLVCPG